MDLKAVADRMACGDEWWFYVNCVRAICPTSVDAERGFSYQKRDLETEGLMGCETVVLESDSDDEVAAIDNMKAAFKYMNDDSGCEFLKIKLYLLHFSLACLKVGLGIAWVFNFSYKNIYNLYNTNILANISIVFRYFLYAAQIFFSKNY